MARIVSFLFTDIEGSASLWERHRGEMPEAIRTHDALGRSVAARHAGRVIKTTGDGMFAVFADPLDALLATVDLQRELAGQDGHRLALRVRCGVHAGEGEERDGDYVGDDVNRAARIMGAAHGGQVLLSTAAFELVRARCPAEITFDDLGQIAIRGSARPERVYQVRHPALPAQFPPLRAPGTGATNLPQRAPALLGREADVAQVGELIATSALVSIVGAGGIGKTSLAQDAARAQMSVFDDGVWWIDVAPLTQDVQVLRALASVLGVVDLKTDDGLAEVLAALQRRRALIVLDNCEHLLDAIAAIVGAALDEAPRVRWLATSQQPLKLAGEAIYRLDPLAVPPQGASAPQALEFAAVALLAQRAHALDRRFHVTDANVAAVIDICARLDGIPLAIEMAAARIPALGAEEVRTLLHDRFRFLAAGQRTGVPRHRTLHATLDWSHALLDDEEQAAFRRLAVFSGGFTLELAQQVAGDGPASRLRLDEWRVLDALASLVDKSLVQVHEDAHSSAPRYLLLETARLYALERLDAAVERRDTLDRHARVMAAFIERAYDEHWLTADAPWIARVAPELDNLGNALRHAVAHADADTAAAIVGNAWPAFRLLDRGYEMRAWMQLAEPLVAEASEPRRTRAFTASPYAYGQWVTNRTLEAAREAVRSTARAPQARDTFLALVGLAWALSMCGDSAIEHAREKEGVLAELARLEAGVPARCRCWGAVARAMSEGENPERQATLLTGMHELAVSIGAVERARTAEMNLLEPLLKLGRCDEVIARARRLVDSAEIRGERLGSVLLNWAEALVRTGAIEESRPIAREGVRALIAANGAPVAFHALLELATLERRHADAARLAGYTDALRANARVDSSAMLDRWAAEQLRGIDAAIGRAERDRLAREGATMTEAQALAAARLV